LNSQNDVSRLRAQITHSLLPKLTSQRGGFSQKRGGDCPILAAVNTPLVGAFLFIIIMYYHFCFILRNISVSYVGIVLFYMYKYICFTCTNISGIFLFLDLVSQIQIFVRPGLSKANILLDLVYQKPIYF